MLRCLNCCSENSSIKRADKILGDLIEEFNPFKLKSQKGLILLEYFQYCKYLVGIPLISVYKDTEEKEIKENSIKVDENPIILNKKNTESDDEIPLILKDLKKDGIFYSNLGIQLELSKDIIDRIGAFCKYGKYAVSVYGIYIWIYERQDFNNILRWYCCSSKNEAVNRTDGAKNKKSINAFVETSGIDYENIIYYSFSKDILKANFVVISEVDCIVITISGSTMLRDFVTNLDAIATKVKFEVLTGSDEDFYVHEGFMIVGKYIYNKLNSNVNTKKAIFEGKNDLIITGHSLGGGLASILSLMLKTYFKENKINKSIKCVSISPPPIFDLKLSQHPETKKLITTFAILEDIIPRLSINSYIRLVQTTNILLKLNKQNKSKLFLSYHNFQKKLYKLRQRKTLYCTLNECPGTYCSKTTEIKKNIYKKEGEIARLFMKQFLVSYGYREVEKFNDEKILNETKHLINKIEEEIKKNKSCLKKRDLEMYLPGVILSLFSSKHGELDKDSKFHNKTHSCVCRTDPKSFPKIISINGMYTKHSVGIYRKNMNFLKKKLLKIETQD